MNCAQRGCEIPPDSLMEAGHVPLACAVCGHPLIFVMSREEVAEISSLPLEEPQTEEDAGLPLGEGA